MDKLLKNALSRVGILNVSRSTALNPILWAFGIICTSGVIIAFFSSDPFWKYTFAAGFAILLATLVFGFLWLLIKDPDRLQSEKYQIKKQTLQIMHTEKKGIQYIVPGSNVIKIENKGNENV